MIIFLVVLIVLVVLMTLGFMFTAACELFGWFKDLFMYRHMK